jgi:hypothetical protein
MVTPFVKFLRWGLYLLTAIASIYGVWGLCSWLGLPLWQSVVLMSLASLSDVLSVGIVVGVYKPNRINFWAFSGISLIFVLAVILWIYDPMIMWLK